VIEDELRSLLTERAEAVPDNPTRSAEVRSRIAATRRRRVAGTALGLVLLALAGLAVLRLPGTNESLPPGVPAPPWFSDTGEVTVPGYSFSATSREQTGPWEGRLAPPLGFRQLVVARCDRRGDITVRNLAGPSLPVRCSHRVGDHYEGIAALDAGQAGEVLALSGIDPEGGPNVSVEPARSDRWLLTVLTANAPDGDLPPPPRPSARLLADGSRTPTGTTVDVTMPRADLTLAVQCAAGVRLAFSVPTGPLGTIECDPLRPNHMSAGMVSLNVRRAQLARLGLQPGERVALTVQTSGPNSDQWRLFPIDP
jgi:hypothetical protein